MSGTDVRLGRWLDLVGEVLRQPLCELPFREINARLTETFDADVSGLHCTDRTRVDLLHLSPAEPDVDGYEGLRPYTVNNPMGRWYATTRSPAPQSHGRVPSGIADARCAALWADVSRPYGVTEMLCIPLAVGPDRMRAHVIAREEGDFTDAEVEVARRLQPVLVGLERQAGELARLRHRTASSLGGATDTRAGAEDARLTGRELAVLSLLSQGLTAAAIGRRLAISHRTVHKHLEHVYAKLGAGDRLIAVLRAQHAGLLP